VASTIVGVDVGGTSIRAVRFDGDLHPVATVVVATPRGADAIAEAVGHAVREAGGAPVGVAVGMPGRVVTGTGVVSSAVNLGITGPVAMGDLVRARLDVPVHIENDVNAAALGAFHHLELASTMSLAYVNIGTGIAAGFVLGGRLWRGATGGAGEIGHIPMWSHGPTCPCGQAGCAEAVGSGRAVADDPGRRGDVIDAVAWTVQLCVMTLDVDVVAVGGGMTEADHFPDALRTELASRERRSPMLADLGLAGRVVVVPPDAPVGSIGAVLAMGDRSDGGTVVP
jgi:predicted NBD/HSP70 family sugar kinase